MIWIRIVTENGCWSVFYLLIRSGTTFKFNLSIITKFNKVLDLSTITTHYSVLNTRNLEYSVDTPRWGATLIKSIRKLKLKLDNFMELVFHNTDFLSQIKGLS